MEIKAYFENIQKQIIAELDKSEKSIRIAVAWFTDEEIFNLLCNKTKDNVEVELVLIDDHINKGSNIEFDLFTNAGGSIYWIDSSNQGNGIMHNKFCIIDNNIIVTGSYNWSKQAKKNYENISVIYEDHNLVTQYINEFNYIKSRLSGSPFQEIKLSTELILKRVEVLKTVIALEDIEDIRTQLVKIANMVEDVDNTSWSGISKVKDIIELVKGNNYHQAISKITILLQQQRQITVYQDPEIAALKLEIRAFEYQVSSLQDELTEVEKLIHLYEVRHNQELGSILCHLLRIRIKIFKEQAKDDANKQADYDEAKRDFEEFNKSYKELEKEKINDLPEKDMKELKKLFREASKKCHPDVVSDELHDKAAEMFISLHKAYKTNNLEKIKEIAKELEKNDPFIPMSETIENKSKFLSKITELRKVRNELLRKLKEVKGSEVYETVAKITNWNSHFSGIKKKLQSELDSLEKLDYDRR